MKLTDFLQDVGRPIAYYPSLRRITGSTNATIFLCQLLYWKGKEVDPKGWIYKTTEQWEEETGLSYEEQKTARNKLKQAELIEEYYARLDHQMKYRPNTKAIDEKWRMWQSLVREKGNPTLGNDEIPFSLNGNTETTPETTPQSKESAKFVPLYDVPSPFNTPEFLELWSEFSKNRNDKKKPLTEVSIQRLFKKFSRYSYEVVIQAMETAVAGGYQGVFPESVRLNGHAPKLAQPTPAMPSEEELNRQRADVAAKVKERDARRMAGIQDPDDF